QRATAEAAAGRGFAAIEREQAGLDFGIAAERGADAVDPEADHGLVRGLVDQLDAQLDLAALGLVERALRELEQDLAHATRVAVDQRRHAMVDEARELHLRIKGL